MRLSLMCFADGQMYCVPFTQFLVGVFCETIIFDSTSRACASFNVHGVHYRADGGWYGGQWLDWQWFNSTGALDGRVTWTYVVWFTWTRRRAHADGERSSDISSTRFNINMPDKKTARLTTSGPFSIYFLDVSEPR
jgi:hypothetical protein